MKRNFRSLLMIGAMAFVAAFTSCKEEAVLPTVEATVNSNEGVAAEIRSTSASFTLNTKDVNTVAYLVSKGSYTDKEFLGKIVYEDAAKNNRLVAVADGANTIDVYGLEGGTEYTACFAFESAGEFTVVTKQFTTPAYDRVITVLESKKDGFKFHFNVPDTMYYRYAFTMTEWYNSARQQFMYNDLVFLMDGKVLKGPQTIEINNGDYWYDDYDPEWDSPWYIHPGSAYTVLMAECDAEGNLLYEENPNYDPWGGDVWGPLAPATRVGTTEAPRMGEYSEEAWTDDDMYPTGVYARQNLLAALKMVDSKINVELVGKTERRIKVRCTTEEETQYIIAPMMKAQYDDFVSLVSEDAVASTLLEYYGADVQSGTQDFEFDENSIWVELDSTYVISVVGVYNDDASEISFDTLHVTLTKSTLPAAEVEITGVENAETPNLVWFNIKAVNGSKVYAAKHISNYTKEVQKMINDGNTYEDLINSYGEYLTEEDVQAINSAEGLNISIVSMEDTESTLIIGAFNEEEGMSVYTGVSRSAELPAQPKAPNYDELAESLKGDWTARIIQQKSEYSYETFEYTYYVDTTYTTVTLGVDFNEQTPESFTEGEAYDAVFNSYVESAMEKGATEEEAAAYATEQVQKYFNDYKAMAKKDTDKYTGQNYIMGVGFEDAHTYASPWDLFCATNYTAYDVEELFYAYGPKLFFQVQQDGSLYLLGDANIQVLAPVAAWGYYEYVIVGNNPNDENTYYNGGFPVEVSADKNTLVIKGVTEGDQTFYPALGYWSWGWLSYAYQTMADIELTRGVDQAAVATRAANADLSKASLEGVKNNRIKRTYLPTEMVKVKSAEMTYVNVLEKVQEKFNKYNARLNK